MLLLTAGVCSLLKGAINDAAAVHGTGVPQPHAAQHVRLRGPSQPEWDRQGTLRVAATSVWEKGTESIM